jgi:hypothetical protein
VAAGSWCDDRVNRGVQRRLAGEEDSERSENIAVEPAVAADRGLSTLGRASPSRGRAAHDMNEGRRASPAVLPSTITNGPCR